MKNKKGLLLITVSLIAEVGYSQTSSRVEKALNDPMRAQNEAKADVYIQSKQNIHNSTIDTATTQTQIKKEERVQHINKKSRG